MTEQPSWQLLLDRMTAEPDDRIRDNLQMVGRHVVAEVAGDIDALMATLVTEPVYRIWGCSESVGPVGAQQVREHYEGLITSGKNRLEFHITRVTADADAVITEGEFRFAYRGTDVDADPSTVDADSWYLVGYQCLVVWPIAADGRIAGEDLYTGENVRVLRRLAPGEKPNLGPVNRDSSPMHRGATP